MTSVLRATAACGLLAACAARAAAPDPPEVVYTPSPSCRTGAPAVPQILSTSAAELPAALWEHKHGWETLLTFRVDETGVPADVHAVIQGPAADADDHAELEEASAGALARYRFCPQSTDALATRWSARMLFRPGSAAAAGAQEMYVQSFIPSYSRQEERERRSGTARVKGTFDQSGRPTAIRLVASSGDAVLDRKSLDAMFLWQLVYKPGTVLTRPLNFEQPYIYVLR